MMIMSALNLTSRLNDIWSYLVLAH